MKKIINLLFLLLPFLVFSQLPDNQYIEPNMFSNTVKYLEVKKSANKSPHLKIRIDKALETNKLFVEQIGFRYSDSGVEFAVFFKQPIPNLNTQLALIVYDKSGKLVVSQGFRHNANEYKTEPQVTYVDYLAPEGDVVILRLMEATKIAPATVFDQYRNSQNNLKWVTATLPPDAIPPPPMAVGQEISMKTEEGPADVPKFEIPQNMKNGKPRCFRAQDTNLYGYFKNDSILVPFEYEELDNQYSNFMRGKKQGKYGAINAKGQTIIPFEHVQLQHTPMGFVVAGKTWREFGLLNRKNETLVPLEYREAIRYSDSIYIFEKANQQLVIELKNDQSIKEINRFTYESMGMKEGYTKFLWAKSNGKQGVISLENKVLVPFEYKSISWIKNNLICFEDENNKKGIVNFQQKTLIPAEKYPEINACANPTLLFVSDEKYKRGVVDTSGKLIVPMQYWTVWDLDTSSFIKAQYLNGKWALWNTAGKQLSPEMYEDIVFKREIPSLLFVQHTDRRWQFLNRKGDIVSKELYNSWHTFTGGMTVTLNDRLAVFNSEGKQLTQFNYSGFAIAYNNEAAETMRKKLGLPDGIKLLCMMYKNSNDLFVIDVNGKEYPGKY
jgi:hypothetical protein